MPSRRRISSSIKALLLGVLLSPAASAQPVGQVIDQVIANVAGRVVLYSELASRLEQARQAGETITDTLACGQLESMMYDALLLEQARIDSVVPDDAQVTAELEHRIRYFEQQIGGREKLEKFYGKSETEIKADFHDQVADQLLTNQMRQKIIGDVRVTPKEVERFFRTIPKDSLPFINAGVQYARIVKYAKPTLEEERRVKKKLEEIRDRVQKGEDFCVFATLYSEDPGSKNKCGELGMVPQGVMVPEFDAVALSLKEGELSQVFKSQYGYHLMQLVERRGDQYNARHILISAKVSGEDRAVAEHYLDSVVTILRKDPAAMGRVATDMNDDEDTRGTNGTVIEPNSNSAFWAVGELDQRVFLVLDKLQPGDWSAPRPIDAVPGGSEGYEVLSLRQRTEPHVMDLVQDYPQVSDAAEERTKQRVVDKWINEKLAGTWVRVIPDYASCPFQHAWVKPPAP